eukprot:12906708-Prorocentrum_lima.AAC.1
MVPCVSLACTVSGIHPARVRPGARVKEEACYACCRRAVCTAGAGGARTGESETPLLPKKFGFCSAEGTSNGESWDS